MKQNISKRVQREIFVLTPEEKRTLCFVLLCFVLGLATEHYRAAPPPALPKTELNSSATASPHRAQKRAETKRPRQPK